MAASTLVAVMVRVHGEVRPTWSSFLGECMRRLEEHLYAAAGASRVGGKLRASRHIRATMHLLTLFLGHVRVCVCARARACVCVLCLPYCTVVDGYIWHAPIIVEQAIEPSSACRVRSTRRKRPGSEANVHLEASVKLVAVSFPRFAIQPPPL